MEKNSLWREVSEDDKEEIRKEAKGLLDTFSRKLSSIEGIEEHFESSVSRGGQRQEGEPWKTDPTFRDHFFLNAPFVEDEFLVTEKGNWR